MSDRGLREALEELCDRYDRIAEELSIRGGAKSTYDIPGSEIRYLLAAHPAAPAVPQPAECTGCYIPNEEDISEGSDKVDIDPACDVHRGFTVGVAWAALAVPQPAGEAPLRAALEKYFSDGGPDTPIRTTWPEGVEHWEAPAGDIRELIEGSAVPQPAVASRDEVWEIISGVRDAAPRAHDDAPTDDVVDALLAAHVFRELPTQETLSEALLAALLDLGDSNPDASPMERCRTQAVAVLAVLAGEQ